MRVMRVVSYNILDGGEGRADPLAEVILAQKPDIVAIVEADNPEVLERLGKRLQMEYIHAEGRRSAAALFSRWPIRDSINHAALEKRLKKAFLEATVIDPAGQEITFGVIHLPAHAFEENEEQREASLKMILRKVKRLRDAK